MIGRRLRPIGRWRSLKREGKVVNCDLLCDLGPGFTKLESFGGCMKHGWRDRAAEGWSLDRANECVDLCKYGWPFSSSCGVFRPHGLHSGVAPLIHGSCFTPASLLFGRNRGSLVSPFIPHSLGPHSPFLLVEEPSSWPATFGVSELDTSNAFWITGLQHVSLQFPGTPRLPAQDESLANPPAVSMEAFIPGHLRHPHIPRFPATLSSMAGFPMNPQPLAPRPIPLRLLSSSMAKGALHEQQLERQDEWAGGSATKAAPPPGAAPPSPAHSPSRRSSGRQLLEERLRLDRPEEPQLEILEEASTMFREVYEGIVARAGGEAMLAPPKEIVWLNGAPGAGKGANTPFILRTRGFEARAIQVSDLLADSVDVAAVMRSGGLVGDEMVLRLLLERILTLGSNPLDVEDADHGETIADPDAEDGPVSGAVVDGFPRTTLQVDFIKLLHDRLMDLHQRFLNTPLEARFPRPIFRIAVLYVEEEESVRRQLARGQAAIAHNQRVRDSGIGELKEVRPTDLCEKSARRRYRIFKQHYDTLLRLKAFFPFHLIDGMGTLAECREQIEKELQYQSALELNVTTFRAISHIPLASDVARHARQNMVARLDAYQAHEPLLFKQVIDIISSDVLPIIRRSALSGIALFNTENPAFLSTPVAAEMLADILSERGYAVTWQTRTREIPLRVDPVTHAIECSRRRSVQFRIKFERPHIRTASNAVGPPTSSSSSSSSSVSSLLIPRPSPSAAAADRADTSVCQNVRPDGTPSCFQPGSEERSAGVCGHAEGTGVTIPGLPGGGKIVRDPECPPLPDWAAGGPKGKQ